MNDETSDGAEFARGMAGRRRRLLAWMALAALLLAATAVERVAAAESARQTTPLAAGWRFLRDDPAGAEGVAFDDSSWATVRVPHDWAIAGPFIPKQDGYAGKLPWQGIGWYRHEFTLNRPSGSRIYLDFDGVMAFPKVYVNGHLAGAWDYGYTSFRIDATPFVNLKGKNVVAVRVDTIRHGTRWYPGAGIYRKATLEVCGPVHLAPWGVYVTTPKVSADAVDVSVVASVENHGTGAANCETTFALVDPAGKEVDRTTATGKFTADGGELPASFTLKTPALWDVDAPNLYSIRTTLAVDGREVDQSTTPFGVRSFEFTADDGLHLNGRRVDIHGVNLHHDQGPLGAAFNVRAMQRQLEIMKDMGVNALRTSHNPPAPEVLRLCDQMGILVWDEAFDKWDRTADRLDGQPSHQEHGERHLRNLVLRDRNHPSIIVWSIGNEIPSGGEGVTPERVSMYADIVRTYDDTRVVSMASCFPDQAGTHELDALDVGGWNYLRRYELYHRMQPGKPIIYSESASALSTRGYYRQPLARDKTDYGPGLAVDSYDLNSASWSDIPDVEFALMDRDRFVAGEFVWTGSDYLGEPTPHSREAVSSYFGIVDLCGIPKDRYWLYRSRWRPDAATVHILPHWNWPDRVGQNVPVFVYTNGDTAELFVNGKSLGRRTKGELPARPTDWAARKTPTASSSQANNDAVHAVDGESSTRWCAAGPDEEQWLQVDLGESRPVRCVCMEFERESKNYGYEVKLSEDGRQWRSAAKHPTSQVPRWGGPSTAVHETDGAARYVRIEFSDLLNDSWASIRDLGVFSEMAETAYYDPTYTYRLRWNDVMYEPGVLKAVAYLKGKEIGSAEMRTAGKPAALRLTPDRTQLAASGEDLSYILVEAVDDAGTPCPLADDRVAIAVAGAGDLCAVGNGDPTSLESFQSPNVKLFYGKAMLIVRTREGESGEIHVTASAPGLKGAEATAAAAAK